MVSVALVHDWLTGMRGGERCLEALCELYPEAPIFTLVHVPGSVSPAIESRKIISSFIQRLPARRKHFRAYLPLFPTAIEDLDLGEFRLIISSSHCVAKGIIPHPEAVHVCYCHTPMRYVWSMYHEYAAARGSRGLTRRMMPFVAHYLRSWDALSSLRVDRFVANSQNVRKRIRRYYGRDADVVYPPVETAATYLSEGDDGYYLIVSARAPYKRVDLAVSAFSGTGERP